MSEMEEKLGSILGNPQMMQQIMALAQSMGQSAPAPQPPEPTPAIDPQLLGKLTGILSQSRVDGDQRALLNALGPYLSPRRMGKLEKAMGAARLARAASSFLSAGGLQLLQGR